MKTPLIKWTGSKRQIAPKIVSFFPQEIDVYYEPFLGVDIFSGQGENNLGKMVEEIKKQ